MFSLCVYDRNILGKGDCEWQWLIIRTHVCQETPLWPKQATICHKPQGAGQTCLLSELSVVEPGCEDAVDDANSEILNLNDMEEE